MKTKKAKQKIIWKDEVTDILLALGASLIALFAFKYFNPPIENILSVIIFMIVYFGLENKK